MISVIILMSEDQSGYIKGKGTGYAGPFSLITYYTSGIILARLFAHQDNHTNHINHSFFFLAIAFSAAATI